MVSVICHGAPSPKLWSLWCSHMGVADAARVNFRDKSSGWRSYSVSYGGERGKKHLYHDDWYMKVFLSDLSINRCCLSCRSRGAYNSDFVLGDFWGIWETNPDVPVSQGVSAVICVTEKAEELFARMQAKISCGRVTENDIYRGNPSLKDDSPENGRRGLFMNALGT